jgi:hypothetical protein
MNQIATAAKLALATCPKTKWVPGITYDYDYQLLSFETMRGQLIDEFHRAEAKLLVMIVEWGRTAQWSKFRDAPVYFLNEILKYTAAKESWPAEKDFPDGPPPWDSKHAAAFLDRTRSSVVHFGESAMGRPGGAGRLRPTETYA